MIAAVFGFWELVLPQDKLFKKPDQLDLPMPGLKSVRPPSPDTKKTAG